MPTKIFLSLVGLIYAALSLWCAIDPQTTSQKVGFDLHPGDGQSEFLVVYGGWEMAMAIIFLLPWFRPEFLRPSLLVCLVMHGCLVVFRTLSFFLFADIGGMTINLAIGEWVIFVLSVLCFVASRKKTD